MSNAHRLMLISVFVIAVAVAAGLFFQQTQDSEAGVVFVVTETIDPGAGGCTANCTLREAITAANAAANSSIHFNIAGCGGVCTITPATALPTISQNGITIDGETQPGYAGAPLIELVGTLVPASVSGLFITGDNARIRGLVINDFTAWGIRLDSSSGTIIRGNYIGTDETGTSEAGNNFAGILMTSASSNNVIGGDEVGHRNLISGNESQGVFATGNSNNNRIIGNYIGTDVTGTQSVANLVGLQFQTTTGNEVGGAAAGEGNLISGNFSSGIELNAGGDAVIIKGNLIGTDVTGSSGLGNGSEGISASTPGHTIGGTEAGARNVISGNDGYGITANDSNMTIQGNYIGTDASGMSAIPNTASGSAQVVTLAL